MSDMLLDNIDINWQTSISERELFRQMWADGVSIQGIAESLGQKPLEVGLLIIDQAYDGKIKPRERGLLGGEEY